MRKLILLSITSHSAPPFLDQLVYSGYQILPITDLAQTGKLIGEHNITVGLVLIEGASAPPAELETTILSHPNIQWIALVAPESLRLTHTRALIGTLFHDYHTLPIEPSRFLIALGHAHGMACIRQIEDPAPQEHGRYQMVGTSPAMQRLYNALQKTAETDVPALVTGESGTGKELVARAMHRLSSRARGPFVAVNCAALPTHLIHSELFGHEKGAFTGAHQRKIGRLEAAAGGTIFLDEIGDLPSDQQAHLLRFLQDKIVERLGSTVGRYVDVRVICATNIDLEDAVEQSTFRDDLYYRINVLRIQMPPLREREDDAVLLAQAYFEKFTQENHRVTARGFSQQALSAIRTYHWPGNVRELTNRVRCAMIMSSKRLITALDLGLEKYASGACRQNGDTLHEARLGAEQEIIMMTLRSNGHNMSQTARQLGISRATLYRKLSRLPEIGNA